MSAETVKQQAVQARDNLFVVASLGQNDKIGTDNSGKFVIYKPSEVPVVGPLITRGVRYIYGESVDKAEGIVLDLYKTVKDHVDSLFSNLELRQVEVISRPFLLRVEYNAISARLAEVKGWMGDIAKAQAGLKFQVDMYLVRPKLARLYDETAAYIREKDELVQRLTEKLKSFPIEEIDGTKKVSTKVVTTRIDGSSITTEVTLKEDPVVSSLAPVPLKPTRSSDASSECRQQAQKKVSAAAEKKISQ